MFAYGKDDYSIYDSKLRNHLKDYDPDLTPEKITDWFNNFNYKAYNEAIENLLNKAGVSVDFRRRKFDNLVWFNNR